MSTTEPPNKGAGAWAEPPKSEGLVVDGDRHLIRVLAAVVERVRHGQLRVEPPAQHQLEQGELRGRQDRARHGLQLIHVVAELKLDILRGQRRCQELIWGPILPPERGNGS